MDDVKLLELREKLSALADGQLRGGDFAAAVEACAASQDARSAWHAYHLVGDVLRGGEQAVRSADGGFMHRFQQRMASEAPLSLASETAMATPMPAAHAALERAPANDASFRWKLVAGCASLAAVVAVSWNAFAGFGLVVTQPQLAQATVSAPTPVAAASRSVEQPVTLANGEPQVMIRDPRLDELLAAHKQLGGTSALQMPAGFLRNATFDAPSR